MLRHRIDFISTILCCLLFLGIGVAINDEVEAEDISYQLPPSHRMEFTPRHEPHENFVIEKQHSKIHTPKTCSTCQQNSSSSELNHIPQYINAVPQSVPSCSSPCDWEWEVLPDGLVYKSYLAGPKESRFKSVWLYESNRGSIWDVTIGGRVGLIRKGTTDTVRPQGWQFDLEGAVFPRLDMDYGQDLESADFRFGLPLTWSNGPLQMKLAYYHISSHIGDEYLERNPTFQRINYVRDAIVLGFGYYMTNDIRLYAETAYAFNTGIAKPLEFQFGAEYSPHWGSGKKSAPFIGINGMLFEEHDFGGNLNILAGWQWRGNRSDRLFRFGLQYFNGKSSQYSFYDLHEQLIGLGLWLDY